MMVLLASFWQKHENKFNSLTRDILLTIVDKIKKTQKSRLKIEKKILYFLRLEKSRISLWLWIETILLKCSKS